MLTNDNLHMAEVIGALETLMSDATEYREVWALPEACSYCHRRGHWDESDADEEVVWVCITDDEMHRYSDTIIDRDHDLAWRHPRDWSLRESPVAG